MSHVVTAPIETNYKRARGNNAFTAQMLGIMRELVHDYLRDGDLIKLATTLRGTSRQSTLENLFLYLKTRIKYVDDRPNREDIRSARRTVLYGEGGDCDDMAVAAATMLKILGFPAMFRAVQWRLPEFTHVYAVTYLNGNEVAFDLTEDRLGATVPGIIKIMDLNV